MFASVQLNAGKHFMRQASILMREQTASAFYNALWQYRLCENMQGLDSAPGSVYRSLSNLGLLCQTFDLNEIGLLL